MGARDPVNNLEQRAASQHGDGAGGKSVAHHLGDGKSAASDLELPTKSHHVPDQAALADSSDDDDAVTFHDAQDDHTTQSNRQVNRNGDQNAQDSQHTPASGHFSNRSMNLPTARGSSSSDEHGDDVATAPVQPSNESAIEKDSKKEEASKNVTDVKAEAPSTSHSRNSSNNHKSPTSPTAQTQDELLHSKKHDRRSGRAAISEWSHQRLAPQSAESDDGKSDEEEWKAMPALGEYDIYDDDDKLVAKGTAAADAEEAAYGGLGGAGKGYTRVQLDEDAQSATSMDEDTSYLFKEGRNQKVADEDEQRDARAQLDATKDLLTESQRIAYVGVTRLTIYNMVKELVDIESTKGTKKDLSKSLESMEKWGQQMMVRLYGHMDIDSAEQVMIEQLAEHGVQPADLAPPLMQNSRVKNPNAVEPSPVLSVSKEDQQTDTSLPESKREAMMISESEALPLKDVKDDEEVPNVQSSFDIPQTEKIDLDLRWTALCDLFLVLISDSIYDARSRVLLERVASIMEISWLQVCRFEKRVTDAIESQEEAVGEQWNEADHMEKRRKMGLKHKYVVMGLATVGGGLVIGLSAGVLAPVIGAGLAAGFGVIGVSGTAGFLGGVGGAALITSAAAVAGGTIAVKASHRRTGAVRTFEYRPLHNSKRVNLILTVSGWMSGKVDDVRLPYSTVDPIMGDIYSLLWEPEMLQSMGDTINILATEALTTTIQQVLGATFLVTLMAGLQLPVVLTKLAYLIDNPWTVSLDRANAAGLILADSLIDRHLGNRPITLLGFSLGSRLIFSCLRELAKRGAYGLVQNVYLFGSPIVAKKDEYMRARSVISGRFVNGYATHDWILGYLFRATSGGIMRVAGLAPVEGIPGLENINVTSLVAGHMAYRTAMPRLLREVGWEVESDEFTEIEDADPENHDKRQRELIREIDEARKEAEAKPEKMRFGFFKRGKLAEKKGWETYDAGAVKKGNKNGGSGNLPNDGGLEHAVLFDIDAIRHELESEMIEVRELESTLPPIQIDTKSNLAGLSASAEDTHVKALLLQQGIDPDEIAKLKLPPRPEEIAEHHILPATINSSPKAPVRPPSPEKNWEPEFEPRELTSTLPPLTLSPSLPQSSRSEASNPEGLRPQLKSHHTTQPIFVAESSGRAPIAAPVPPQLLGAVSLEHNAWADADDEYFGKEREIQMTFE